MTYVWKGELQVGNEQEKCWDCGKREVGNPQGRTGTLKIHFLFFGGGGEGEMHR